MVKTSLDASVFIEAFMWMTKSMLLTSQFFNIIIVFYFLNFNFNVFT